jgi:hypothetical protein
MRTMLILALLLTACTPQPDPTLATRIAAVGERIAAMETAMPPIGTAVAECYAATPTTRPTWQPTTTPNVPQTSTNVPNVSTPTPTVQTECRSCEVASECPSGQTCVNCRGIANFCVPIESPNGGCARCLEQLFSLMLHSYDGPPAELIDLSSLMTPSVQRRFDPGTVTP